jgi:glucokinase
MKKGFRLGVDLGGTSVKLALVDENGALAAKTSVVTVLSPRRLAAEVARAVRPWCARPLLGTGVGVAGDVDPVKGVVRFAPNLKWRNVPLKKLLLGAGLPGPLRVENDANAAAWGAYHVELKGRSRNLVVLTLGTGVGGGLVFEGNLYRGATGSAGELGHMVVDWTGPLCACGNRGCLEAYLGGAAMVTWARAEMARRGRALPVLTPKILEDLARAGNPVARAAWTRAADALGVALANVVNALNPDTIVFTGGVARGHPLFLPRARKIMSDRAFKTPGRAVRLKVAGQNEDLGVIGAALLVD